MVEDQHNNQENTQICKDPWIMYLIVRESLNMSVGKIAAQSGHGVDLIHNKYARYVLDLSSDAEDFWGNEKYSSDYLDKIKSEVVKFDSWLDGLRTIIVKRADDREWEKLKKQLDCFVVIDAGLTEIKAESETVIALWPMLRSATPPLIKRLRLL